MMHDRPRRLRQSRPVRELVAETRAHKSDLIQPHFVVADDAAEVPVDALPGISRQGVEPLLRTVEQDLELGITSAPKGGSGPKDRKTYQMDYRNRSEAVREAVLDVEEGADVIMVKPALAYLDVIQSIRGAVDRPVAAYLVSGEYAAVEALAEKGLADRAALVHEHLTAVRRAGADILITYHARRALREGWLD